MSKWPPVSHFLARREELHPVERAKILPTVSHALLCSGSRVVSLLASNLLLTVAGLRLLAPPALADLPQAPDDSVEADGRFSTILLVDNRIFT
jgi:hypothetical protein